MKTNTIRNKTEMVLIMSGQKGQNVSKHIGHFNIAKADKAKDLYLLGVPVRIICQELYIARSTLYNYLRKEGVDHHNYINGSAKIKYSHN
jgi:hypothetical protein